MSDQVSLNSWETAPSNNNSTSRIFAYVVRQEQGRAIEHHNAVIVSVNFIRMDPTEAALYNKYTLCARVMDPISNNHCICRILSSEGNIGLEIFIEVVLLDMSGGCLCQ